MRCHDTCTHLRLAVLDDPPPPPCKCNLLCLESSEGRHATGRSARNLSEWFLCSPRNRSPSAAILILRQLEVHVFKIVAATRTQEVVHVCQNDLRPRRVIDHLRPVATSVVCAASALLAVEKSNPCALLIGISQKKNSAPCSRS